MASLIDKLGLGNEAVAEKIIQLNERREEPLLSYEDCEAAFGKGKVSDDQYAALMGYLFDGTVDRRERLKLLELGFSGRFVYRLAEGDALERRVRWIARRLDGPQTIFETKLTRILLLSELGNLEWPSGAEKTVIRQIRRIVRDGDADMRREAMEILLYKRSVKTVPLLIEALRNSDSTVRYYACNILKVIGAQTKQVQSALTRVALNDDSKTVRLAAILALKKMGVELAQPK